MKKKNFLLIIGNGFDLDLGLRTKYKDFIDSNIYDEYTKRIQERYSFKMNYDIESDEGINIFSYFKSVLKIQNWIDLEMEIGNLATRKYFDIDPETGTPIRVLMKSSSAMMDSFNALRECLNKYISHVDIPWGRRSYASELLNIIASESRDNVQIVNFNYTNLKDYTGIDIKVPIHHIHGTITSGHETNIILGVQDDIEVDKSYSYVIKSHSPFYRSSRIIDLLEEADEVIFFGHSLGETDYPYFSEFFQSQCKRIPLDMRKKIRIFTFDESSRLDILYQLRIMNNKQTRMFFENSDFALYRTKDKMDDKEIQIYFSELKRDLSV